MMHQPNKRLEQQISLHCTLMQECHQGFQRQISVDVWQRSLILLDREVSQQVQVLHEVGPMVLLWVVSSLRLHQIAFLVQFRQRAILSVAVRGNL